MSYDVTVRVVDHEGQPVGNARVEVAGPAAPKRLSYSRATQSYTAPDLPPGEYTVSVAARGYLSETRQVAVSGNVTLTFILGKRGMRFYYRGHTRIPFKPKSDLVAVSTQELRASGEQRLAQAAERLGLESTSLEHERWQPGFHVYRLPRGGAAARDELLRGLARRREVLHVGAIVETSAEGGAFLSQELVAKFKPDVTEPAVSRLAGQHGLEVLRQLPYSKNAYQMRSKEEHFGYELLEICDALMATGLLEYAEPNLVAATVDDQVVPTDFLYPNQWHLPLINMEEAWQVLKDRNAPATSPGNPADLTFGNHEVVLAVMDRGIESQTNAGNVTALHPDFSVAVTNGASKVSQFFDFANMVANNDAPPNNHGMGVAGVAAAVAENPSVNPGETEGAVGPAANCRVMGLIRPAGGTETQYADAYYWAAGFDPNSSQANFPNEISPGADIITNSFGAFTGSAISGTMSDCFDDLTENGRGGRGVVLFFSAGNGNTTLTLQRPWAAYEKTIAVAASTQAEVRANYSNFGPEIDVCAPSSNGSGIVSCDFVGGGNLAGNTGGPLDYRNNFGGTSSATPLTAGVAALMLSVNPFLTWSDAREILRRTAVKIDFANTDPTGQWVDNDGDGFNEFSQWYGYGRIDAEAAVREAALYMVAHVRQLTGQC